ncbi:MAG TPA: hypothetical protein VMW24_04260 [Sedimentisphaerales bacterium]|nr:hypothetical protein [Sedimentisphaerales bacterium]
MKAMKALDDNFMNLMLAKIGSEVTDGYTKDSIDELNALLAKKEKIEVLEKRVIELEVDNATLRERTANYTRDEAVVTKAAGLEARNASLEVTVREHVRMETNLREQISKLDAQISAAAKSPVNVEYEEPTGCQIDVIRGGDDRMRSLVVRYTKS